MFAPRYGINEESATGMAAGPLACYLYDILAIKNDHFLIEQGHDMPVPSPSLLYVDLTISANQIQKLFVGGKGVMAKRVLMSFS